MSNPPSQSVIIDGVPCVLLPGQLPTVSCFVPLSAITWTGGSAFVHLGAYMRSHWASRNMQLHIGAAIGSHCFPRQGSKPLDPFSAENVGVTQKALRCFGRLSQLRS